MTARLLRTAIIVSFILSTSSAFAQHTYYISKSLGSDSNSATQAQSKSTPWAHLPGMPSCASNCASYTPVAGDHFILYGGDTWVGSDLGINFFWNGSATNCVLPYGTGATSSCMYIGTDQTWYGASVCGSSFCRPIFTCGGANCAMGFNVIYAGAKYVVIDDVEITGMFNNVIGVYTDQEEIEARNLYVHGWSHSAGATSNLASAFQCSTDADNCVGTFFHDSVIDGADTSQDMFWGTYGGGVERIYNNYYRYTSGAVVNSGVNFFYNNTVEYAVYSFDGNHGNAVFVGTPLSGNYLFMFNNVIRHTTGCAGCVNFWFYGDNNPNPSLVAYGFNNVLYDLNPSNIIDITGSAGSSSNWGTYYLFNNTVECGTDSSTVNCTYGATGGHPFTLYLTGNHWITSNSVCGPATCPNEGSDELVETVAQASANGYTTSQTSAFSPTASNSPTVGKATNRQSYCTTLSALDAVTGTACQSDATNGVGYDTTKHKVLAPDRGPNPRPTSGAWDIGAYEFTNLQSQAPQPPTNLQVAVQ